MRTVAIVAFWGTVLLAVGATIGIAACTAVHQPAPNCYGKRC
jgi:hypothetical protein